MHVTLRTNDLIRRMDQCTIESDMKSSTKEQQDRFLNSLRYEGMNQRKNDINSSFEDTFQWIFDYDEDHDKTPIQSWDDFEDWLKSDSNIYWVSGKPGSGKSTLMKYLLKSPFTEAALKIWNTDPIILISITLGSIINTPKTLPLKQEAADWDVEELKDLYFKVLGNDMFPVCIFLDGLDEICEEDGPFSLLKLIDDLRIHPKIKICVSSRPEPVLQSNLCGHQQLRLHDLAYDDMKRFAVAQIQPYVDRGMIARSLGSDIIKSLMEKAEGAFLWLHLASRSLIGGIEKGDTGAILRQRLEEMPNELKKLYSDMWERMNGNSKLYRKAADDFPVRDPTRSELIRGQQRSMWVEFIHRTAYDFMKDTEEGHRIRAYGSYSSDTLYIQLVKGHLIMAKLFRGLSDGRFGVVLEYLSEIKDLSLQPLVHEMLRRVWTWYHERYYLIYLEECCTGPHFLALLTDFPFRNFILSAIKESPNPSPLATHVLRNINSMVGEILSPIERLDCFLEPLLALGADATSRGPCIISYKTICPASAHLITQIMKRQYS
ncbi:hypothetical protein F4813DRAFT_390912 [Daldinia decipiens]|uniref:uncharacterized protein n=1 Tax=Daldinia decipiens TaxID=326647 RepID=UPI0020C5828E|nr:uncharacterized protein F4813DRAFT_390912 [Daldinia decipiens]KAI1656230.1 hypothetical protein F4813DRAFT_390912 [Daldinia decipiens]